jgi:N4-(beta-N-acetylglucosaminyl)-L-asparaginase
MDTLNRRDFIAASAASVPLLSAMSSGTSPPAGRRPTLIGSGNAVPALRRAMDLLHRGNDLLEAIVRGVNEVENDPEDMSVGYGGLPNEQGVVELDAAVMHGPMHKAGAVAALRNVRNPASVALEVLRRTDHVLLVGDGALEFARAVGFEEQDLLTEKARTAWLRWKANLNPADDWLDADQQVEIPHTDGTIHVSGVDADGDLACCTSTSGLSYKIPGRVGDSPIAGAGLFCDNEIGTAGSTGRGESVIQSAASFQVVRHMGDGLDPTEACLRVLKWIADHTRRHDLLNPAGEPNFQVVMYALRKDGAYGAAAMRPEREFAVHEGTEARLLPCPTLFEE